MGSCSSKKNGVLILLGSNSKSSIHRALLDYMMQLDSFSDLMLQINVPDLKEVPFYSQDFIKEGKQGIPLKVNEILGLVSRVKKIIFLTPQYNGATSPDLINFIQWINEVNKQKKNFKPFHHKSIGIISCSYISKQQIDDLKIMISDSQTLRIG